MSLKKLITVTGLAVLSALANNDLAAAEDDLKFNLAATVQHSCGISSVVASDKTTGFNLRVVTVCNAPSFQIIFDGVTGLELASARSINNFDRVLFNEAHTVEVRPQYPGAQFFDFEFVNDEIEISDLIVNVHPN